MKVIYIKKQHFLIGAVILILLLGVLKIRDLRVKQVIYLPITNKIVAIDAGHGGLDPGTVSKSGIREDEINLKIARNLQRLIEHSGGIVVMTRENEKGLYSSSAKTLREMKTEDLHKRKKIVDDSKSEIFISIHLNSFTSSYYSGAQTFYKKDAEESEKLALIIQEQLRNTLDPTNTREPQKRDDVYLLNEVEIPTVLVECGFLSNEEEAVLLSDELYQEKVAWAIYIGIMNYFNEKDRRSGWYNVDKIVDNEGL